MPIPEGTTAFDSLVAELVADQLRANPVLASGLGVTEHDSELPDLSAAGIASRDKAEDDWVRRHRALRGLRPPAEPLAARGRARRGRRRPAACDPRPAPGVPRQPRPVVGQPGAAAAIARADR